MLRYFPTLYDQGPPFVIGNLDYSFDSQGGLYPAWRMGRTSPALALREE